MQVQIHYQEFERTEAIEDHINMAVSHLEKFAKMDRVHVHLKVNSKSANNICKVEIHANHKDYSSKEESDNMYKSIDMAVHKIETQLRRDHDVKVRERKHNGSIKDVRESLDE